MKPAINENNLADQLKLSYDALAEGNKSEALRIFDAIFSYFNQATDFPYLIELSNLSMKLEQYTCSIDILSSLVTQEPENPLYLDQLAVAHMKLNRLPEAYGLLKRALKSDPDCTTALINISAICINKGDFLRAIEYLTRAYKFASDNPMLLLNLTNAYNQTGQYEEALGYALKALKYDNSSQTLYSIGSLYAQLGQHEKATEYFYSGIETDKTHGSCYFGIASQKKFKDPEDRFIRLAEESLEESMLADDRSLIHFSLGKAFNDLKMWDKAFEHFKKGNLLRKPPIDPKPPYKLVEKIRETCTFNTRQHYLDIGANTSEAPIFIIGMPRSGSTLTEQIITSHSKASTIGESGIITRFAHEVFLPLNQERHKIDAALEKSKLGSYADKYLEALYEHNPSDISRVINKSPGNHMFVGFILRLFPNAKFIHTVRNPLDICLSCYMQPFSEIDWASDFKSLANSYKFYRDNISFWKEQLPADTILDVCYETLLEDSEAQSRKILEFCGLDWDPKCLEFFDKKDSKPVRTASLWQVRQPLYKTSKNRWHHYACHLEEIANELIPFLSENDINYLAEHNLLKKEKKKNRLSSFLSRLSSN